MSRKHEGGPPVSVSEAGRLLGRHRGTISAWLAAGCPGDGQNGVRLGALLDWRERQAREAEASRWQGRVEELERLAGLIATEADNLPESEWRRRKRRAEALLREIELEERQGALVPVDLVQAWLVRLLSGVRSWLFAIPSRIAAQLAACSDPARCHEIVEAALREATDAIADGSAFRASREIASEARRQQ